MAAISAADLLLSVNTAINDHSALPLGSANPISKIEVSTLIKLLQLFSRWTVDRQCHISISGQFRIHLIIL